MTQWGMVVDLGRCVGCQTCTVACKMENGLPPSTLWRTVLDLESGEYPDVQRQFFPMTCMQCADPPCHDACPTTATKVRPDGIVWIDNDLCIGCGSCVVACPYQARHIVETSRYYFDKPTAPEVATYDTSRVGICTKCNFCFHKFDDAPEGIVPGKDAAYTPACSSSCIADAILFGDLEDPESRVSEALLKANSIAGAHPETAAPVRMLEHLDTKPSVYYLNARNIDPRPPQLQHTWHKLAVTNFFCGTTGAGLYLLGSLHSLNGTAEAPLLDLANLGSSLAGLSPSTWSLSTWAGLLAPLLVSIGLLAVAAEAGRPFRGFNVFRNISHSWMSRESACAMVFIIAAVADTLLARSALLQLVAVIAGMGVAVCQGLVLADAKGVPAWNVPVMPWHFAASALTNGFGALALLSGLSGMGWPFGPLGGPLLGLVLTVANLMVWQTYLATPPKTGTFMHSVAVLRSRRHRIGIDVVGHLLPMTLLIFMLVRGSGGDGRAIVVGALLLIGGLITKSALILKAAYLVDMFDRFGPGLATSGQQVPAPETAAEPARSAA